jgi:hypothetical protein
VIKRAIIVGFGAIIGARIATRISHKMREHCKQMAAQCKEMAGQFGGRGQTVGRT